MADTTVVVEGKIKFRDGKKVSFRRKLCCSSCGTIWDQSTSVISCFSVEVAMVCYEKAFSSRW